MRHRTAHIRAHAHTSPGLHHQNQRRTPILRPGRIGEIRVDHRQVIENQRLGAAAIARPENAVVVVLHQAGHELAARHGGLFVAGGAQGKAAAGRADRALGINNHRRKPRLRQRPAQLARDMLLQIGQRIENGDRGKAPDQEIIGPPGALQRHLPARAVRIILARHPLEGGRAIAPRQPSRLRQPILRRLGQFHTRGCLGHAKRRLVQRIGANQPARAIGDGQCTIGAVNRRHRHRPVRRGKTTLGSTRLAPQRQPQHRAQPHHARGKAQRHPRAPGSQRHRDHAAHQRAGQQRHIPIRGRAGGGSFLRRVFPRPPALAGRGAQTSVPTISVIPASRVLRSCSRPSRATSPRASRRRRRCATCSRHTILATI